MPQPRRSSPGSAPKPKPKPRPAPTQTAPETGQVADTAAVVAAAIGAAPGAASVVAGLALPTMFAKLERGAVRSVLTRALLVLASQSRARGDVLRYFVADVMARVRPRVTAGEVRQAARAELGRERTFRQRQRARLRLQLAQAAREPDPKRRAVKVQGVLSREQHYSRLRELAIAARAAGAANARNVRDASPEGAVWLLGHRKEHCPGCAYLHGRALTWAALIGAGYLPPVGPGCGCELRGIRQAWLANLTDTLRRTPTDAESLGLIATARALGHPHGHDGGATMIGQL